MAGGFALVSGANLDEGINGLIANAANMLPWVVLAIFLAVAWKSELVGGILITLFGAYILYYFNFSGPNFFMATFILTSIVLLCGILFIVSHYLQKK